MSVIVTSDTIRNLCTEGSLTIIKKRQKANACYNYYITPNLTLKLYEGRVVVSDAKFLVLQFDKYTNLSLLQLLRTTTSCITDYLKRCADISTQMMYSLCSEQENTFTVRVYLPNVRQSRYFIETKIVDQDESIPFRRPNVGVVLRETRVEIRNVWEKDGRTGFNLELKYVGL
jgi:hypothetical protein